MENIGFGTDVKEDQRKDQIFRICNILNNIISIPVGNFYKKHEVSIPKEHFSIDDMLTHLGIEPPIGQLDFQQHYKLGQTYYDMGLVEDAISEFLIASKGEKQRLESSLMLGLCFLKREEHKFAINHFKKGLELQNNSSSKINTELHYYLGSAYEQSNELANALQEYKNAFLINKNYRDVATKIEQLEKILKV